MNLLGLISLSFYVVLADINTSGLPQVVTFGDSLTFFGYFFNGWTTKLQKSFETSLHFINGGHPSYTTEMSLELLSPLYTLGAPTALTIIFLGANDAGVLGERCMDWQVVPLDRYKENLKFLVHLASKQGKVLLVTPPPVDEVKQQYCRLLNQTAFYRDACLQVGNEMQIPVIDTWPVLFPPSGKYTQEAADTVLADGIHFTSIGNDLIYEAIYTKILRFFPDLQSTPQWTLQPTVVEKQSLSNPGNVAPNTNWIGPVVVVVLAVLLIAVVGWDCCVARNLPPRPSYDPITVA
ncbi:SGNH hydrolase-type esterase domain-containing protein [Globomyces pollinis-pini]|nr:SGNH hydrolase-type esterase domain-containing protein [Globomyces pollinis-pini]